jgi:manganese oxidase
MLLRYQLLSAAGSQVAVTPTPHPTPDGVFFTTPEILPEGDPRPPQSLTGTTNGTGGG